MAVVSHLRAAVAPFCRLGLGILSRNRAYGSAAAAQLQYDYESEDDEGDFFRNGRSAMAMEETRGSETGRGVQWVIMGEPAVKRHLYADRLSKLLDVPHISMGTLVRQELHPRSSLYKQIADAVNQGKLVPDEVILALLSRRMEEGYNQGETGFILDGIPRTRLQAEILDRMTDIDLVVNLKCQEDSLVKNYLGGYPPQELSTIDGSGPNIPNTRDAWKEKLCSYAEQMKSLEDYYMKQKKILEFHVGVAAPGETWQGLLTALHLQHLHGLNASQKLTV